VDREVGLIVCGAPLAARTADLVAGLQASGWTVSVVGTPASADWIDLDAVAELLGEPVRLDFRSGREPKRAFHPHAVLVCPATFNTINKAAAGVSDTYALGVLCEALGSSCRTYIVPMVNDKLWGHPAWPNSLATLAKAGATLVDVRTGELGTSAVPSGTGNDVVSRFDPAWITSLLGRPA
jgi:phosphopantothenoylcysteine decarboxylase